MKTGNRIMMLFFLLMGGTALHAQQYQEEVPGDNFSLEGALELFKKSASPEEFERLLNSADAEVNNLDLNGDGDIDYIRVIDRQEGAVHAFILQAVISETESQDIAVIELEKLANGKAVLQITGDADIYGIETIIEPTQEVRINAGTTTTQAVVNVWAWPSVQYVYGPYYDPWISPWHWGYRPIWWNPWRPIAYITYYPRWHRYRPYYSVCYTHRVRYAQDLYRPYRSTSVVVYNRHQAQLTTYRSSRSASGYTRGRDGGREGYNDQRGRSQSEISRGSSRSSTYNRERIRDNQRSNDNKVNRGNSTVKRDESTLRNRTNSDINRESNETQRKYREVQRDNSGSRSNSVNTNTERQREYKPAPDNRSTQRSAPQVERRESSGNSGGQRSASQVERKQSGGDSGQRSGGSPVKSGSNKRGRD